MALKRQTESHAQSSADLRYREVMENLALIYENPAALPAYCSIYSGSTDITDTIPVSAGSTWSRILIPHAFTVFTAQTLDFSTSRNIKKNWTLDPTVVPEKIHAMRCACWWVLFGENNRLGDSLTLEKFPSGPLNANWPEGYYFDVANRLRALPPDWLHVGSWGDVPWHACYRAGCGGKHVWVTEDGKQGLSQFTLVLQDIARASCDAMHYPRVATTEYVLSGGSGGGATPIPGSRGETKITLYVDQNGYVTPGNGIASLPRKNRFDNVGNNSDLKSSVIAATK
jgi:hypothetical protein